MLSNPSIRCAECGSFELRASFLTYDSGGRDVSGFTCTRCAFDWEVWETPQFAAPDYASAYSGAPGLVDEELALVLLAEGVKERATQALIGKGRAVDSSEHRVVLLRKAGWLDRAAREREVGWYLGQYTDDEVNNASTKAARASFEFLQFDLDHGGVYLEGPIEPSSPEWDNAGGTRAYVRQEYRELLGQEQRDEDEDRAQIFPRRGADGELYGPDGKAL
ncbi:hypothetical protein [Streptomyces sp. CT34]|uniref:hypothetical protein n=1 Tax=Streptomyces sp. CT34 TaxID=1553907 RepID=UPI0005BD2437|nr:hypothetical protein [Streptomyces sp. CT34]